MAMKSCSLPAFFAALFLSFALASAGEEKVSELVTQCLQHNDNGHYAIAAQFAQRALEEINASELSPASELWAVPRLILCAFNGDAFETVVEAANRYYSLDEPVAPRPLYYAI